MAEDVNKIVCAVSYDILGRKFPRKCLTISPNYGKLLELKVEARFSPYSTASSVINTILFVFIRRISICRFIIIGGVLIKKTTEINEAIRDKEVRLIGEDNEQLGIMSAKEAYFMAMDKKLDLVKISPNAKPPVCKIMDFGKYKYEQQKREKEAKKKQKNAVLKGIRLGLNIESNDLEVKAKNARKFIAAGDKVKVSLRFRGRELGYTRQGYEVIDRFAKEIEDVAMLDAPAKMEGRSMVALFVPKK